jgi:hypothetical protein
VTGGKSFFGLRRRTFLHGAVLTGVGLAGSPAPWGAAAAPGATDAHEEVVRDARMEWLRLPEGAHDAPLIGCGTLAAHVHRAPGGVAFALRTATGGGVLHLDTAGTPTGAFWELDLWNAELTGTVTTARGSLGFSALVHRALGVLLVSLDARGGERAASWRCATPGLSLAERPVGSRRLLAAGTGDVRPALAADHTALAEGHRRWWHDFHRASLVSTPDRAVQRLHVAQLYRAASGVEPDTAGFLDTTGHAALSHVTAALDGPALVRDQTHRAAGLPGLGSRAGGAPNPIAAWNLPLVWEAHRRRPDDRLLHELLLPALREAVGFYVPFLTAGPDGLLHLPPTRAPGHGDVADCTHDLALLRWGLRLLGSAPGGDPRDTARWRDAHRRLVPYHEGADGVLIGAGVPLGGSRPDPAHLLWLHPLRERVDRRSLAHWRSARESWHGGSHAAASALCAAVGAPDDAVDHLEHLVGSELTANAGCAGPDAFARGAPFSASRALLDLVLSGERGEVRVFPAVPRRWRDLSITGLRAPGALVVDASRRDERTEWVRVRADAPRDLVLRHGISGEVEVRGAAARSDRGTVRAHLAAGQEVLVLRRGTDPDTGPRQVAANGAARRFGLPERRAHLA